MIGYLVALVMCVWTAGLLVIGLNSNYDEREREWRQQTGYEGDIGW